MMSNYILLQLGDLVLVMFGFFLVIVAFVLVMVGLLGSGVYGIYKLLFSAEYQDTRDSASEKASEAGKSINEFVNSPEGKATLSVIEAVTKEYESQQQSGDSVYSVQDSPNQLPNPDELDQSQLKKIEQEIRQQGVNPKNVDMDELFENVENDRNDWR